MALPSIGKAIFIRSMKMSNEELVDLIQKGNNPSEYMEQLYLQNVGYIRKIAKKYSFMGDIEDLMQEAYFGLYKAVQRYEDTAGVLFMSYAAFWIRHAITRYLENNGRGIRLTSAMNNKIIRYKKAISDYELQLGRKPTEYELTMYLGINSDTLKAVKKACQYNNIQSIDEFLPGTEDLIVGDSIPDQSIDLENDVINGIIEDSLHNELWQIVKDNVTPEENTVIMARYRKDLSLEATGQLVGCTKDKARGIEAKALRKLRLPRIRRELEEKFEVNYARVYHGSLTNFKNTWSSIVEDVAIRNLETVSRD